MKREAKRGNVGDTVILIDGTTYDIDGIIIHNDDVCYTAQSNELHQVILKVDSEDIKIIIYDHDYASEDFVSGDDLANRHIASVIRTDNLMANSEQILRWSYDSAMFEASQMLSDARRFLFDNSANDTIDVLNGVAESIAAMIAIARRIDIIQEAESK